MKEPSKAEQEADQFFDAFVDPMFAVLDKMNKNGLKAVSKKMAIMYGTANFGIDLGGVPLNLDEADICMDIASLANVIRCGETLSRDDMETLCKPVLDEQDRQEKKQKRLG